MARYVQKYGGTSVGSIQRIDAVADKIKADYEQGHQLVVVVSAMSGETNRLIELAAQVGGHQSSREMDVLLSTGEQVTVALLTMALKKRSLSAYSLTGWQAGIHTSSAHGKARINRIDTEQIEKKLDEGSIVVVAGFQGVDDEHNITTLGRGGSDTTGVALAVAVNADEAQIYTDVDGVYTSDPRVVPKAQKLNEITFEEMLEMASLGTKVLQIRAVEFAGKYQMPVRVLSSFETGNGTLITTEENKSMENPVISGIAFSRDEAQITVKDVRDVPGVASKILGSISAAHIEVDMIIQTVSDDGATNFTFTVHKDEHVKALEVLNKIQLELNTPLISSKSDICKISLVGVGMRSHAGVASQMFNVLASESINILAITTSEIKISVLIEEKYLELATRSLHSAFGLDSPL